MDITTASPVEIDTEIVRLGALAEAQFDIYHGNKEQAGRLQEILAAGDKFSIQYAGGVEKIEAKIAELNTAGAKAAEVGGEFYEQANPFHAEFNRRGGWQRFFLVTSSDGHVHTTVACSTCYPTTQFCWLTEFSGMDTREFVEVHAGEKACTTCYPWAPVNVLRQKTKLELPTKREARLAREAKAAEKAAKVAAAAIFDVDGGELLDEGGYPIKTLHSARIKAVQLLVDVMRSAEIYIPQAKERLTLVEFASYEAAQLRDVAVDEAAAERIIKAIAVKEGTTVEALTAEFAKKADKKMVAARKDEAMRKSEGKTVAEYYRGF